MKILFITKQKNDKIGSYRIWVNNLSSYLTEVGVETRTILSQELKNMNDFTPTVVILCKSLFLEVPFYRAKFKNTKLGVINPDGGVKYDVDFVIVGSIEEKDSLIINRNVFIFPLVEKKFIGIERKTHIPKKKLVIGYHGSHIHLMRFNLALKEALERFSKECDISLKLIIDSSKLKSWPSRPNISIDVVDWNLDTFSKELSTCDIGIAPTVHNCNPFMRYNNSRQGLYKTDYIIRFKNKSNAGRSFVFIQHGIPVVSDFIPSNFHLFGNPDNGFCVNSLEGWLEAFRQLKDSETRKRMSQNAYDFFIKEYDPIEWSRKLVKNIEGV